MFVIKSHGMKSSRLSARTHEPVSNLISHLDCVQKPVDKADVIVGGASVLRIKERMEDDRRYLMRNGVC